MYVLPFWSYRPVNGESVITNWLTKKTCIISSDVVDYLEAVYSGAQVEDFPAAENPLLTLARAHSLIFDSQAEAAELCSDIERGWFRGFPVVDQIELTNRCPYSCKMCPRTTEMSRALGNMPLELFERIIAQISGQQDYVGLHHFGESLLHPELAQAVALARRYGLNTGLSCNPPTLRPALAACLLDAGLSNVVLSLDSLDAGAYREIRGAAANFERADANLREFVRLRDHGQYSTFITLQMISMRCNEKEADQFLEYCRQTRVDRGVVIKLGRWDFDDAEVEKLGEFNSHGYKGYCTRPWDSVVVLWDGRVVPCCHDYNGAVVFGDLKRQSLAETWQSPEAIKFRGANHEYELCQKCAFSRWYREGQRTRMGFRAFHLEDGGRTRKEWINPDSLARVDGRLMFDGFDVVTDEE
jgi:radical SAM protein with 4Fe4S-binding SPASM domain